MERVTFWDHVTDDQDDDVTTSSVQRLIDVIVTSEHLQHQRNLADVPFQLLSNGFHDELAVQVCRTPVSLCDLRLTTAAYFRDDSIDMTWYAGGVL